jgi:hypothetical protein
MRWPLLGRCPVQDAKLDVRAGLRQGAEFRTAAGEELAISVLVGEIRVLKHFQKRMPYGLFVPWGTFGGS